MQAQIIASTSPSNNTKLEIAANVFGFAGLVLDILGTTSGVIYALRFRKTVSQWPPLLQSWVKREQDTIDKLSAEIAGTGVTSSIESVLRTLQTEIFRRRLFWMSVDSPFDDSFHVHISSLLLHADLTIGPFTTAFIQSSPGIHRFLFRNSLNADLDQLRVFIEEDPRVAIGAGITFLLLSVAFFATSTQPKLVWSIAAVTTIIFALSLVVPMLADLWSSRIKSGLNITTVSVSMLIFGQDLMQIPFRVSKALP